MKKTMGRRALHRSRSRFSPLAGFASGFVALVALTTGATVSTAGCSDEGGSLPTTLGLPKAIDYDALYVANGASNTITLIDANSYYVYPSKIYLSNTSSPRYLALSADKSKLLVTAGPLGAGPIVDGGTDSGPVDAGSDAGGEPPDAGEIPDAGEQETGVPFTRASRVLADESRANRGAVLLLNATTGVTIKGRFTDKPTFNAVFGNGDSEIWASTIDSPGQTLVLTPTTLADKQKVQVENVPGRISMAKNGRYAFVVNTGSDSVTVIDTATKIVRTTLKVGKNPGGVWQGNNDLAYIDSADEKKLTSVQTTNLGVRRVYDLGFVVGTVAAGPDGYLWITDPAGGRVFLYQPDTDLRVWEIATGAGAYGIAFSDDGESAYVANATDGTVSAIDVKERRVRRRITGVGSPTWITFRKKDKGSPFGDAGK